MMKEEAHLMLLNRTRQSYELVKLLTVALAGALLTAPAASIAGECSRDVTIKFIANDADRARDWNVVYGRYVLRNNSKKRVEISAYKSDEQPVLLYPFSVFVQAKGSTAAGQTTRR